MATWYKVGKYSHETKPIEVTKFTDKSVWYPYCEGLEPRRNAIHSQWENHFPTWEEAHAFLLERFTTRVARLKKQTHEANSILGQIKKMTKPEEKGNES